MPGVPYNSKRDETQPYCNHCGYTLTGLTDSSKCPECGKPLVEVLTRDSFPGIKGYRYTSKATIGGLPWLAIAQGPHGGEKIGRAVGFVAIGDAPKGIIAIGGMPLGVVAIGGISRGIIAMGGLSFGVFALGGIALGGLAFGGVTMGVWVMGGLGIAIKGGMAGLLIKLL